MSVVYKKHLPRGMDRRANSWVGKNVGVRPPCGTYAGWQHHKKMGEPACPECKAAYARYMRAHRFRAGSQHDLFRCNDCGSVFPDHACHWQVMER